MAIVDEVLDDTTVNPIEELEVEQQVPQEEELPEKYRGKSAKEIAKMHEEAEKLISRQGGEVGELRKVVDEFIKTQTLKELKKEQPPEEETDYFVDPKQAVNKAIDNHPAVKEAQQASLAMRKQEVLGRIGQKFPNYMETIYDPAFADWVKSSRIRMEMFARAEAQLDYDAADELLSTWQERQGTANKVIETADIDRKRQLNAASVTSQGSTETVAKKKYRRADIIKLMQTDPDRYDSMSNEIMAAYREGRVI